MSENLPLPKSRKWNLPLTYAPKIEAVKAGTCRQTIRVIGKAGPKRVGDLISLHGYVNGRGTPWTWRTPYKEITVADTVIISGCGIHWPNPPANCGWSDPHVAELAARDGIVPPTGESLRDVLISKNGKIPSEGIEVQIIRWSQ